MDASSDVAFGPLGFFSRSGNQALRVNPPNADIALTRWGSDWLWAVFSIMAATTIGVLAWSTVEARRHRAFHYLFAAVLATASVAYFSMASDLGATPITVEFLHGAGTGSGVAGRPTRQIWYARYIDWTITTPLLLLSLLLITPMPLSSIWVVLFFDVLMVVCGLVGALVRTSYKWGYFTLACAALFYVLYSLFGPGVRGAGQYGSAFRNAYVAGISYLGFLFLLYPISWGLSEGGNVIGVSSERPRQMVFFGVLDLLTKPAFCLFFLAMLSRCDYDALDLRSGKGSEVYGGEAGREVGSGTSAEAAAGRRDAVVGGGGGATTAPAAGTGPSEAMGVGEPRHTVSAPPGHVEKVGETGPGIHAVPPPIDTSRPAHGSDSSSNVERSSTRQRSSQPNRS
ncbi:related to YRO2 - putative plasma membrane protein, transcriptionally regulated by Haa1p [Pseudozyma flocculosa]|uniref:Related to YRO2 - putative plasma membrane protein, transcriptionally regulated by Haa1p n=1 Tax=Pseudozyma flocculosa TaxID=84751 RepID=A0A5C3F6M7_9BASI|nr:related to YRO2 - putative plasma membrane protein, transcriptionally regulated by Haa1p [Pseudozyma flocculosa]